jgi:glycopeptide antibiotics resistance protein
MIRRHPVLTVISVAYLALVAWITLGPQPLDEQAAGYLYRIIEEFSQHRTTAWLTYSRVEFLANIALFVPVGVLILLMFGRRWWWVGIIAGGLLTCAIEFAQRFLPDRVSDPRDLVANTIGAAIGAIAALVVTTPAAIRERRMRDLEAQLVEARAAARPSR